MSTDLPAGVRPLTEHECWSLLRRAEVGRLAVVVDGQPDLFPVNFVVDHGTVVLRTGAGTKLAAATGEAPVAFECDGVDQAGREAWSVVLKGRAELLRTGTDLAATVELPLSPWQEGPKPHFLRLAPHTVTGRRFPTVDPTRWALTPTR